MAYFTYITIISYRLCVVVKLICQCAVSSLFTDSAKCHCNCTNVISFLVFWRLDPQRIEKSCPSLTVCLFIININITSWIFSFRKDIRISLICMYWSNTSFTSRIFTKFWVLNFLSAINILDYSVTCQWGNLGTYFMLPTFTKSADGLITSEH